jgi:hypothetical protein
MLDLSMVSRHSAVLKDLFIEFGIFQRKKTRATTTYSCHHEALCLAWKRT